ncbi:MAG: alpha/beta hydrolase [Candidatus Omnitrophica bacterium]|nr:alpha/beta hydrolase [Candidatus Omnitrophota bacterium]MDD5437056.1 alpha/beta hydrolase [Candidatus Omnitrophota bacterium]
MLDIIGREELEELNSEVKFFTKEDGRRIAFYEYGDPGGTPIIFCHGTGSHVHVMLLHKAAKQLGYRVIVPDRPGIGLSDFDPKRKLLDGASDIVGLAGHLGIGKFGVMGISGGVPALLASAYSLAERLTFVVDLAGAVPLYRDPAALKQLGAMDRFYAILGAHMPLGLFQIPFALLGFQQRIMKNPKAFADMMRSSMCKADMELFNMPEMQYLFMRDFQELFRQGARPPALDAQLIYLPWGFDIHQIKIHVDIRQGADDRWIPPYFSQYLAKALPDAALKMIPDQGHFYHMAYAEETLKSLKK